MYLHLGQDKIVTHGEIIGIFDLDNTTVSKVTRDFLAKSERRGSVINVSYELPKSFILCGKEKTDVRVYISPISVQTLVKRSVRSELA
ncbi:MAG: DUF370 domain-containing protein [Oscillospiraceae bacterium]|nr:DUF370 domain-containing protein [Oscillospiraceae bacterium]